MMITRHDVTINYRDYGDITIPKGTRLTHHTACGIDEDYHFVADTRWIKPHSNGTKQYRLIWDATHYGINIDKRHVIETGE